jgi:hypothetical protein
MIKINFFSGGGKRKRKYIEMKDYRHDGSNHLKKKIKERISCWDGKVFK